MTRIKKNLHPVIEKKENNIKKKIINLNNKNNNNQQNLSFNEYGKSQILDKDTFCVLKSLASNGKNLPLKIDKTTNKVNSLLDIILPNPDTYKRLLKNSREEQMGKKNFDLGINDNMYPLNQLEQIFRSQKELDKQVRNKMRLEKIINTFKNEITKVKNYELGFERKMKNKRLNKLLKQNPLIINYNKILRMKKKENKENSLNNDQTTSIMTKKNKDSNLNKLKYIKKEDDSSFLNNSSKIGESFSIKDYKNLSQSFLSGIK